jgi:hypothetical protein
MCRGIGGSGLSGRGIIAGSGNGDWICGERCQEVGTERDASDFDAGYYGKLLRKAWDEVAFVFKNVKGIMPIYG